MTKRPGISSIIILALVGCAAAPGQTARPPLDTTTFVVMGEGLAAGMANYGLSTVVQQYSFPAQIAKQMGTAFVQPLIQPPGIGDVIGYPGQEVKLQVYPQGSVRQFYKIPDQKDEAPPLFVMNLSVPGFTLADATTVKPELPVARRNMKQTVVNMLLGFPQLFLEGAPLWTQFEYAKALNPTLVLVELGFYEALDAAVSGQPSRIPDPATFGQRYSAILAGLRAQNAEVIATTIPNPIDTAYFSSPLFAAQINVSPPFVILGGYQLTLEDYVTRNGLMAIANQFLSRAIGPLPAGSTMRASVAADITARVNALNAAIRSAATSNGAVVYDLNAFFRRIRTTGARVGNTNLTADYLGGFYSLDAVYPGPTGHALLANDVLAFINTTYGRSFPLVNPATIAANDQAVSARRVTSATPGHTAASLGLSNIE